MRLDGYGRFDTAFSRIERADELSLYRTRPALNVIANFLLFAGVSAIFLLSSLALDGLGFKNYASSGGSFLEKVHPGSFAIFLAFAARLASERSPARQINAKLTRYPEILIFAAGVAIAVLHAALIGKNPITPFFDSFLLPFALFWLIEDLDETTARRLALLLCLILTANSVVGLIEGLSSWRLVTVDLPPDVSADPSRTDLIFDWRAALALDNRSTALLGHPLSNAMTTSAFVVALAEGGARWLPAIVRFPAMGLAVISLATFGGRAGMALTYIFLAWKTATILFDVAVGRRRFSASQAAIAGAAAIGMALAVAVAYGAGIFDTVIQRFTEDAGSANARLVMFDLFKVFSWEDLLLRPDPELLATIQRVEGLEFGIESFWIVFALQFGLIVAGVLLTGVAAYCLALYRAAGVGAGAVLAIFFVIASTSTSISGKSTGLALLTALILLILRRDTRPLSVDEIAPEGLSQPFLHKFSTSGQVRRRVS